MAEELQATEIPGQLGFEEIENRNEKIDQVTQAIREQLENTTEESEESEEETTSDELEIEENDSSENLEETPETTDEIETESSSDAESQPESITLADGRSLSPEQLKEAVEILDWAKSLPDEAKAQINALLSGQYQLVEVRSEEQSNIETQDEEEYLDPKAAEKIAELEKRLSVYEASQTQSRMTWVQAETEKGIASFRHEHELEEAELADLQQKLANSHILPGIAAAVRNETGADDPQLAISRGLKMIYNNDPVYQQREIDRVIAKEREKEAQLKDKKRKAASLSKNGGSVSREPTTPTEKLQGSEKVTAIANFLRDGGVFNNET